MRRLNLGEVCHGRLCCVAQVSELYEVVFPILISVVPRSNLSTKSERELLIVWTATCTRQHRGNILRCQGMLQVVLRSTYYVLAAGVDLFHEEIRVGVRDVLVGANVWADGRANEAAEGRTIGEVHINLEAFVDIFELAVAVAAGETRQELTGFAKLSFDCNRWFLVLKLKARIIILHFYWLLLLCWLTLLFFLEFSFESLGRYLFWSFYSMALRDWIIYRSQTSCSLHNFFI